MATRTFSITKDGYQQVGGGWVGDTSNPNGIALPAGVQSGIVFRSFAAYTLSFSGVVQILSATLHIRGYANNSNSRTLVRRVTALWHESNGPEPPTTSTGECDSGLIGASDGWKSIDITPIVEAWAPSTVMRSDGSPGGGATNFGLRIAGYDEVTSSRYAVYYSRETAYDSYITLTYLDNHTPSTPSVSLTPQGPQLTSTPTFSGDFTDGDVGDLFLNYDIQVSTDSTFASVTHWNLSAQAASGTEQTNKRFSIAYAGTALTAGTTYYWRARVRDDSGSSNNTSGWSATKSFYVDRAPSATKVSPVSTGCAAIWNLQDLAVWDSSSAFAKPTFSWTYSDPDGGAQSQAIVRIYAASSGGSPLNGGGSGETVSGTATTLNSTLALVRGTSYWWTIEVKDDAGLSSGESSRTAFHVQWAQGIYEFNAGATSSAWSFSSTALSSGAATHVAFIFASATGATGAGRSAWVADVGALTPAAYVNILVRLSTDTSGTNATLPDMTFTCNANVLVPDDWTFTPINDWSLDSSVRRFGTQALKCTVAASAGDRIAYPFRKTSGDDIPVAQNTTYTFSAFVRTKSPLANGNLKLAIYTGGGGTLRAVSSPVVTDTSSFTEGWQRIAVTYTTQPGEVLIRPALLYTHNNSLGGDAFWWDGCKFEEGKVATPWTPGFVGDPVVLDSGGIAVDAGAGGIARFRGSTGGTYDVVQLGAHGLKFGDVEVYGTGAGAAAMAGDVSVTGAVSAGSFALGLNKGSGSTSAQGSITTEVDLTGSAVTWTALAGHTYLVLYTGSGFSTVAGDVIVVKLKESTTTLDSIAIDVATGSRSSSSMSFYLATGLSAGSHTFKLSALRNNGTGTLTVTSAITVIDIG